MTPQPSAARAITDQRFEDVVLGDEAGYPSGSEFVAADTPGLATVVAGNVRERRTTVIVHDDGSEVLIEPPSANAVALFFLLLVAALVLHDRKKASPQVDVGGTVVELPVGTRVQLRAPHHRLAA
jgi:hypothetical protein